MSTGVTKRAFNQLCLHKFGRMKQSHTVSTQRIFARPVDTKYHLTSPKIGRSLYSTQSTKQAQPSKTSSTLPLSGTLVIALEQAIAGPFCTRQLADQGARVIKIERPGRGDFNRDHDSRVKGLCSHFVWTNRSKESLALDLKDPKDIAVLKQLLAKADVMVQNLAPGATERMGLGYDTLKAQHPALIVCDIETRKPTTCSSRPRLGYSALQARQINLPKLALASQISPLVLQRITIFSRRFWRDIRLAKDADWM